MGMCKRPQGELLHKLEVKVEKKIKSSTALWAFVFYTSSNSALSSEILNVKAYKVIKGDTLSTVLQNHRFFRRDGYWHPKYPTIFKNLNTKIFLRKSKGDLILVGETIYLPILTQTLNSPASSPQPHLEKSKDEEAKKASNSCSFHLCAEQNVDSEKKSIPSEYTANQNEDQIFLNVGAFYSKLEGKLGKGVTDLSKSYELYWQPAISNSSNLKLGLTYDESNWRSAGSAQLANRNQKLTSLKFGFNKKFSYVETNFSLSVAEYPYFSLTQEGTVSADKILLPKLAFDFFIPTYKYRRTLISLLGGGSLVFGGESNGLSVKGGYGLKGGLRLEQSFERFSLQYQNYYSQDQIKSASEKYVKSTLAMQVGILFLY